MTGRRHAEHCMGTVFSFDLRPPSVPAAVLEDVIAWLHRIDATFSTYRPGSEICRLAQGEITVAGCAPEVQEILGLCDRLREATGGCFSAYASGTLDPSGVVKGWAVERAAAMLRRAGSRNALLTSGFILPPWANNASWRLVAQKLGVLYPPRGMGWGVGFIRLVSPRS
jgi:thiamine biosynthesis lipoprotein